MLIGISIPPKEIEHIKSYINRLAQSFPNDISNLIANGCPPNPRKIKRIINLIYFLSKGTDAFNFDKQFPLLVIWSILTVAYPELAKLIKNTPESIVQMSLISNHLNSFDHLLNLNQQIKEQDEELMFSTLRIPKAYLLINTLTGIEYVKSMPQAFDFLKSISKMYNLYVKDEDSRNLRLALEEGYKTLSTNLSFVIYRGGLVA
jgi:hypothetical protein